MALPLARWSTMPTLERLQHCSTLTTVTNQGSAPAYVNVTLSIGLPGGWSRGQVLALPPEEAAALVLAGFAAY